MFKIINGNMLEELDKMEENSVGSIVTDPPYEINFMGKDWDNTGVAFSVETWKKCLRVLKPGGYLLSFAAARTQHRIACAIEDAGFEIRDTVMWLYSNGFPKSMDISKQLDKSNLPDFSEKFNGFGTTLKPAYEPIIVARKPLCGTVANNVMTYGVGGINIDECRVPTDEIIQNHSRSAESAVSKGIYGDSSAQETHQTDGQKLGRFPSNVVLTYDESNYDEVCGELPESSGHASVISNIGSIGGSGIYGGTSNSSNRLQGYNDSGSASRYFYCAKASKRDRDDGLDDLPTKQTVGGGGGIGDYADDVNSCSGKFGSEKAPHKNFHPAVKPTSLMQYLVRLVTPKGETILDPFMGSGSTGKAVAYENNDRNADYSFIGIELNPEYCDIAQKRIEFAEKDKTHLTEPKQKKSKPDETAKKQSKLF